MISFFDILKRRQKIEFVTLKIIYNTFLTFNSQIINESIFLLILIKKPLK